MDSGPNDDRKIVEAFAPIQRWTDAEVGLMLGMVDELLREREKQQRDGEPMSRPIALLAVTR